MERPIQRDHTLQACYRSEPRGLGRFPSISLAFFFSAPLAALSGSGRSALTSASLSHGIADEERTIGNSSTTFSLARSQKTMCSASRHSVGHQHKRVRDRLVLNQGFVVHSLRHTALTRLGEAGVDVFTLKRIAGHSSVTTSERYVHPSDSAVGAMFERLQVAQGGHLVGTPAPKRHKCVAVKRSSSRSKRAR